VRAPSDLKDAVGRFGEAIAARFLVDSGYQLLDRNSAQLHHLQAAF